MQRRELGARFVEVALRVLQDGVERVRLFGHAIEHPTSRLRALRRLVQRREKLADRGLVEHRHERVGKPHRVVVVVRSPRVEVCQVGPQLL